MVSRKIAVIGAITCILTTISVSVIIVDVLHNTLHANVLTNALFLINAVIVLVLIDAVRHDSASRDKHASSRMRDLKSTPNRDN